MDRVDIINWGVHKTTMFNRMQMYANAHAHKTNLHEKLPTI